MAKTDVDKTTYAVSDFVAWAREKTLILNPDFQRRPVWKSGAKSFLIDTVLRGLPVPIVYLRDKKADLRTLKKAREVVDGQQRIRTLLGFIDTTLIPNYDPETDDFQLSRIHNADVAGMTFSQLPGDARQTILDYRFGVHVFGAATSDREVLQIFARLNATGVKLNDQELRNAEFYGDFKTAAYELATEQLEVWKAWRIFTPYNIARMEEVELTSELLILISQDVSEKSKSVIDNFYEKYDQDFPYRDKVARRFRHVFNVIAEQFEDKDRELFQKRTLFYCTFAAIYLLAVGRESTIDAKAKLTIPTKEELRHVRDRLSRIRDGKAPQAVLDATTRRTTHVRERRTIIGYLQAE